MIRHANKSQIFQTMHADYLSPAQVVGQSRNIDG